MDGFSEDSHGRAPGTFGKICAYESRSAVIVYNHQDNKFADKKPKAAR